MNIFITSTDPKECAKMLDDKRVIKMVLETTQMLSTALIVHNGIGPYKVTHLNHPCSVWVRTNQSNYDWTIEHLSTLLDEYTNRYSKIHKCSQYLPHLTQSRHIIPIGSLTTFVNCTNYKDLEVTQAYKQCLKDKWAADKRKPTWYRHTCIG